MRISDWSSDVCSSDLLAVELHARVDVEFADHALVGVDLLQPAHDLLGMRLDVDGRGEQLVPGRCGAAELVADQVVHAPQLDVDFLAQLGLARGSGQRHRLGEVGAHRSEEHTSELQSIMRSSYAVFCLEKKTEKQ